MPAGRDRRLSLGTVIVGMMDDCNSRLWLGLLAGIQEERKRIGSWNLFCLLDWQLGFQEHISVPKVKRGMVGGMGTFARVVTRVNSSVRKRALSGLLDKDPPRFVLVSREGGCPSFL